MPSQCDAGSPMQPWPKAAIRSIWHSGIVGRESTKPGHENTKATKARNVFFVFCFLISCFRGAACSSPPEDYPAKIAQERAEKDEFLRRSQEIIFPPHRDKFFSLAYFSAGEK